METVAAARILQHQIDVRNLDLHVTRTVEENRISELIGHPAIDCAVVVGPMGCGKSRVVMHAAAAHRGVATFSVQTKDDNAFARTAQAFGMKRYDSDRPDKLVRVLKKAARWRERIRLDSRMPKS